MKRIVWVVLACILGLSALAAEEAPKVLHFPVYGYSIAPLEKPSAAQNTTLMMMFLPATENFAPSVNVMAQGSNVTIAEYIAKTKDEFTHAGMKTIRADKIDDDTAIFEYSGIAQNQKLLHWYAKAVRKRNQILLATAMATEKQWRDNSDKMQACVDSFQREVGN